MAHLEYNDERHELAAGATTVGSGAQATWRLANADLAARHFTVTLHEGVARLAPSSPQYVVVVNGRQVAGRDPVVLSHGDTITAGAATFRYAESAAAGAARWQPAAERAYLVNEQARHAYALDQRSTSLGRDAASHVLLSDPTVSRFHADVRAEAGVHVLYSLGSSGTRVNGQPLSAPRVLEEGDRVEVGDTSLLYTRQAPAAGHTVGGDGDGDVELSRRATMPHVPMRATEPERRGVPRLALLGVLVAVLAALWIIFF